jgi:hypothetical protein
MAITNRIWIMPPVKNPPKKLIAQIITKIRAIVYNIFPIVQIILD